MLVSTVALLLPACDRTEEPGPDTPVSPPGGETPVEISIVEPPVAPSDPLKVILEGGSFAFDLAVVDAAGAEVDLVGLDYEGAPPRSPVDAPYGWAPTAGLWAPGTYTITRVNGVAHQSAFIVGSYGVEAVAADALVGRAWRVTGADAVSGLHDLALAQGVPWLVVESAGAGEVQFAELLELDSDGDGDREQCVVLRDVAAYDEARGRLEWAWSEASIDLGAGSPPVEARDLWFEVWFSPDAGLAAARAHGEVDTRYLVAGEEQFLCDLVGSFGIGCQECPDGQTLCRREDIDRIELVEETAPDLAALPMCGLDRVSVEVPDLEPIGCDFSFDVDPTFEDCGCASYSPVGSAGARVGMPILLGLLAAARRRGSGSRGPAMGSSRPKSLSRPLRSCTTIDGWCWSAGPR